MENGSITKYLPSAFALLLAFHGVASALTIIQPASVSTSATSFTPISQTIDQSGLTAPYTSGVTDFDTYVPVTGHNNSSTSRWISDLTFPKAVVFDLGSFFSIDRFVFWNTLETTSINAFELFADTDNNFGNGGTMLLGSFNGAAIHGGQVFSFSPTSTQFVHLRINSTFPGNTVDLSVGEFAFRQTSIIPEPATAALALMGLGGLMMRRRRAA